MFLKKFSLFKKRKKQEEFYDDYDALDVKLAKMNDEVDDSVPILSINQLSKQELRAMKKVDYRNKKVRELCENIVTAKNEIQQAINKFDVVKKQLEDVDKIRYANDERKKKILAIHEKVKKLDSEKAKYEKSPDTLQIDTNHYLMLEKNENIMVNEIKKLEGYEKEYLTIRADLHRLEGERGNINFEKQKLDSQKDILKYYVRLLIFLSIAMFSVFGVLALNGMLDSVIPILIAVGAIALNTVYVISAIQRNTHKLEANRLKENKLIGLFNKVKIKYVNSVKVVEYIHRKYDVHNCKELKRLWERYLKEKDRKFRYNQILELSNIQRETLDVELSKLDLVDVGTWKRNAHVFADDFSLLDFEEELNNNKTSIRQSIEANKVIVTSGMEDIKSILAHYDEYREEIIDIMRECELFL